MFSLRWIQTILLLVACAAILGACQTAGSGKPPIGPPTVVGISKNRISVGDELEFYVENAAPASIGWIDVHLQGTFARNDGTTENVDITVPLHHDEGSNRIVWHSFGYGRLPWGSCAEPGGSCDVGCFEELKINATNRFLDGTEAKQKDEAALVLSGGCGADDSLEVMPSFIVRNFLPFQDNNAWIAPCRYPARVAMPGKDFSYLFDVEAIGFNPEAFEFTVGEGIMFEGSPTQEPRNFRQPANGSRKHRLAMKFAPIPSASQGYRMNISVGGSEGEVSAVLGYSFMVRPAYTTFPRPGTVIAQVHPPEANRTGGCESGGTGSSGQTTTYSASVTRSERRSFAYTASANWAENIGRSVSDAIVEGQVISDSVGGVTSAQLSDTRSRNSAAAQSASGSRLTSNAETANVLVGSANGRSFEESLSESDEQFVDAKLLDTQAGSSGTQGAGSGENTSEALGALLRDETESGVTLGDSTNFSDNANATVGATGTVAEGVGEVRSNSAGAAASSSSSATASLITNRNLATARGYAETTSASRSFVQGLTSGETNVFERSESETLTETRSQVIQPSWNGRWMVQLVKIQRYADVVAYDLCGMGTRVGEVAFSDFQWNHGLAVNVDCEKAKDPCLARSGCFVDRKYCDPVNEEPYEPGKACDRFDSIYESIYGTDEEEGNGS